MFGHWLFGLKDEYMRKSKKELVNEIMQLKMHESREDMLKAHFEKMELLQEMKPKEEIAKLEKQVEFYKQELEVYKKKYADEFQLRLELVEMVEKMKKGSDNNEP